jgi:hypothetical protein
MVACGGWLWILESLSAHAAGDWDAVERGRDWIPNERPQSRHQGSSSWRTPLQLRVSCPLAANQRPSNVSRTGPDSEMHLLKSRRQEHFPAPRVQSSRAVPCLPAPLCNIEALLLPHRLPRECESRLPRLSWQLISVSSSVPGFRGESWARVLVYLYSIYIPTAITHHGCEAIC